MTMAKRIFDLLGATLALVLLSPLLLAIGLIVLMRVYSGRLSMRS